MRSMSPVTWPERITGFRSGVINAIIDAMESLRPIPSPTVRHEWRSDGTVSHAAGEAAQDLFPWDKMAFGYALAGGAVVTINGGEIQIGSSVPVVIAAANVTVAVDYCYVGLRYTYATKTLAIANFGASITHNGTTWQKWLYEFRLISGVASLYRIGWLNPSFPSIYADEPT